jgi:hypothetical protein
VNDIGDRDRDSVSGGRLEMKVADGVEGHQVEAEGHGLDDLRAEDGARFRDDVLDDDEALESRLPGSLGVKGDSDAFGLRADDFKVMEVGRGGIG